MTEIRFLSSDPRRAVRKMEIGERLDAFGAIVLLILGSLVFAGLAAAPDLVMNLSRSAEGLYLRESLDRGSEALESVRRRYRTLDLRLRSTERFLARVAVLASVPLPEQFLKAGSEEGLTVSRLEGDVGRLAQRLRSFERLRQTVADVRTPNATSIPSRSPVEPSAAVPVGLFGPRTSPLTNAPEFFSGLALAAPEGTPIVAPADGVVILAGPVPRRAPASYRPLGTIVVLAHGDEYRTLFGHLGKVLVRNGQRLRRGERIALVGRSGFASSFRVHYEIWKRLDRGYEPVDPRLFVLDADWISSAEIRKRPSPPQGTEYPWLR